MGSNFKRLDIYRKVPKDLTQPTASGAVISICCIVFMTVLFVSELIDFLTPEIINQLFVDQTSGGLNKIDVRLNVSLPMLDCKYAGLDIQDDSGRHEVGSLDNMVKSSIETIDMHGGKHSGCRLEVTFQINKVPGNFHLSTHSASQQPTEIDMAHIIHEISFGDDVRALNLHGSFDPLQGLSRLEDSSLQSHEYHLRIVPSIYEELDGSMLRPYQYQYAYKKYISLGFTGRVIPAIWFKYDINPISVKYKKHRRPFYEFLCMTCAIVGGTFTVAGIIDSLVFSASNILEKLEIGKLM
jgi:hypothetical protein